MNVATAERSDGGNMSRVLKCVHCGGVDLYTRRVDSGGGYGPPLLQGLGGFLRVAQFDVILCATCGHCGFFADEAARQKVASAKDWRRMNDPQTSP
jgi:hypothetical protein